MNQPNVSKGRASVEQMADLKTQFIRTLDIPVGVESLRAGKLFNQTVFMDGMRGLLVAIADPRPGRPIELVFTTSHAAVTIDVAARRLIS